jgi:hypothetical protein
VNAGMPPGSMYCNPFGPRAYPCGVLRASLEVASLFEALISKAALLAVQSLLRIA